MDGFLDETCGGVTELRVHGVSGTPPAGTLDHPHPRRVAGDGPTGFYRRWWESEPPSGDHPDVPGVRHREAYAWGNLTSGGRTIALWLLLLPFSLANLSYFMLPRPARGVRLRHLTEAAQRLFGLLLTGTLVGAVTRASVDLVGWQCTAAGRACTYDTAPGWVRWLGVVWGDEPARRLAVTALVPLLVVVLLWWLARRTWLRDERTVPPRVAFHDGVLLARPRLWHGAAPVWRLRVVHVAFSVASIAVAVSAPFAGTPAGRALTVANAGVMLAAAVLAVLPSIARRVDPHTEQRAPAWLTAACHVLRVAAPVVFLATIGAALRGLPATPAGTGARLLPGVGVGTFQYAVTIGLAVFILVATLVLARMDRPARRGRPGAGGAEGADGLGGSDSPGGPGGPGGADGADGAQGEVGERRALGGIGAWVVLMAAAGTANVMALGLLFWTASFFGVPARPADPHPVGGKLFLDEAVWWTAALAPLLLAGLAVVAAGLWLIRRREAARLAPELKPYYLERDDARVVARQWALAGLTDRAGLLLGVLTAIGVAGSVAVAVIYHWRLLTPEGGLAGLLASAGSWVLVAAAVALVVIGRRTYRDTRLRRTVGILWDICTFWPRAIHPLSPPCYTERVVPELMTRVGQLAPTGRGQVVLSGHSQGAVIAAALVLQLDPAQRARVRLLTHGSPLRRIYTPFFPAYFGDAGLSAVRERVSWCNLYRMSDPIGGPAFRRVDPLAGGRRDAVDLFCWDPPRPGPGEPLPATRWHVGYWLDPSYDAAFDRLVSVRTAV
ncbi:hypothetical protein [Nonomuraea gerenzanensis]|uniref:Putative integral membrane protein n=1 Tax=Nonomuraea gerenzanensis TaxID=93944 RepID=A0A1M4E9F6_9ACTN|nr:hypothetical protein [Nonomuraea gerenzanensis]UBU19174.1 hypothetical protein LCN96_21965 [Nonomuraea gerenzanensis]SBO95358.1 putative integral membrane protein [Nonomuraea gerenzanensis]